jgi:hypothetical protein
VGVLEWSDEPIVEHDEIDVCERGEFVPVRSVRPCDIQVVKESWSAEVSC